MVVEILKKELKMDVESAIPYVEKIITDEGFSILLTKSIDEVLKRKLGLATHPKYTIILACEPMIAKKALDASFDVGLLFPCSFVIYEQEGKTIVSHVSIMKIASEIGLAPTEAITEVIEEAGKIVSRTWNKI